MPTHVPKSASFALSWSDTPRTCATSPATKKPTAPMIGALPRIRKLRGEQDDGEAERHLTSWMSRPVARPASSPAPRRRPRMRVTYACVSG
jgi:hypothetical protein